MHTTTTLQLVTPDGRMPVRVFEPTAARRKGGVLFYMDAFGLRPELDGMCRSYADAGFVVFMPDLYYRLGFLRFAVPRTSAQTLDPAMMTANLATTVEMTIADTGANSGPCCGNPSVRGPTLRRSRLLHGRAPRVGCGGNILAHN